MVDFAKAFDVTDHKLLLRKLRLYGIDNSFVNFISSYLSGRTQIVPMELQTSSVKDISYGVPQESVLGPILFSIYINDLPLQISANCDRFADDTTIFFFNCV